VSALHTETRGRFRWLCTVEDCDGATVHTARTELPSGVTVERITTHDPAGECAVVFVTDLADGEITLSAGEAVELRAALDEELP
jgi:hypothetical protein